MSDPESDQGLSKQEHLQNGVLTDEYDEEERAKMRPIEIDADMKEMERRKRVEAIMTSRQFKEELERIIELQLKEGFLPDGLIQHLNENSSKMKAALFGKGSCVIPINDIRGAEQTTAYAKGEKQLRCKLAATYRLVELHGWGQNIYNHIAARVSQDQEHFLVSPFGLLYHEVTASSLVKVDMQGNVLDAGTTNLGFSLAAFTLHGSIFAARPDVKCVIHIHTPAVVAISSLKHGILPICQEACILGDISYHEYNGIVITPAEKEQLARSIGPINKVLLLRNHGVAVCGETIEEAFMLTYYTSLACETQIKLLPVGIDNLILIPEEQRKAAHEVAKRGGGGVDSKMDTTPSGDGSSKKDKRKWKFGELEFEALMRMLDGAGYRTGYNFKHPLVKSEVPRTKYDIEVPPAVSSLGYLLDEEDFYKQGIWRKLIDGKRSLDKTKWLNSPNTYQKVEILETGTPDPKKIIKLDFVAASSFKLKPK